MPRPRLHFCFRSAEDRSGNSSRRPAAATMGERMFDVADFRFDPVVSSRAGSTRTDACSLSGSHDATEGRRGTLRRRSRAPDEANLGLTSPWSLAKGEEVGADQGFSLGSPAEAGEAASLRWATRRYAVLSRRSVALLLAWASDAAAGYDVPSHRIW